MEKSLEELMSEISVGTYGDPETQVKANVFDGPVLAVGIQEIKSEVQDMVNESENDFYLQNIEKDMDVIEKDFVRMERKAAIIDAKIFKLKVDNQEVFDELERLENQKKEILKHEDDFKEVITNKLANMGEKKWMGMEVSFTYVAPSFKTTFNKKRFETEQPQMYAKYMDTTPVKAYVKTKLSLNPILPEEFEED